MAMLAEPKRKKKWSLNPRGKLWANDESKLGQKLLEKMGWSKGRGLGRTEQGDLEPVRLRYKNDSEGVGYTAKDDQWVAHREEFSAILEGLNGSQRETSNTDVVAIKSLEVRSKSSKTRVHYHKFTRGKDLSRYSSSDMACILGTRPGNQPQETEDNFANEDSPNGEEATESSDYEHSHGVTTIRKGNINDYFASKMAALQTKKLDQTSPVEVASEEDGEDRAEKKVRFNDELNVVKEFCSETKIVEAVEGEDVDVPNREKKKKRKKKRNADEEQITEDTVGEALVLQSIDEAADQSAAITKAKKKKKKKKERRAGEDGDDVGVDVLVPTESSRVEPEEAEGGQVQEDVVLADGAASVRRSKKKSKRKECEEDGREPPPGPDTHPNIEANVVEENKRHRKRKRDDLLPQEHEPDTIKRTNKRKCADPVNQLAVEEHSRDSSCKEPEAEQAVEGKKKREREKPRQGVEGVGNIGIKKTEEQEGAAVNGHTKINGSCHGKRASSQHQTLPDFSYLAGDCPKPKYLERVAERYSAAGFHLFKGANLYDIAGYGHFSL